MKAGMNPDPHQTIDNYNIVSAVEEEEGLLFFARFMLFVPPNALYEERIIPTSQRNE